MQSMTGFGRAKVIKGDREYKIDIRTVNHKYNDVNIIIPKMYSWLDSKIRKSLSARILRGKIDVSISIDSIGNNGREVVLDEGLADLYFDGYNKIKNRYGINSEVDLNIFSRIPNLFKIDFDEDEDEIFGEIQEVLDEALDNLIKMRENEGEVLFNDIFSRSEFLKNIVNDIKKYSPLVVEEYRKKLSDRVNEILNGASVDEGRLEVEVALFADKCNIDEEITRLGSHLSQFQDTLKLEGSIGKKLDFIIQEMNREINTIGSKSNNLDITNLVINFKYELEKIREQVQNVE